MKTCVLAVAVAFSIGLLAPSRADAQFRDSLGGNWNNAGSALLGTMINNRILADAARNPAGTEKRSPDARPAPSGTAARLTFRPVAKNLMVKELADTFVNDPEERRQLAETFEGFLRSFDEQALKDREPANDLGRAAAYFVMLNYFAATGQEPTDAQADGAQAIFRAGLAESKGFAAMSDRDRQRLYESLIILGSLPLAGVAQAGQEKNGAQEKVFRQLAAELVKTLLGVPVTNIRLTGNGFTIDNP